MKTFLKFTALSAVLLMLATGLVSCKNGDEKTEITLTANCEDKEILKILINELGFIRLVTDPAINRLCYYFFEPITPIDGASHMLHVDTDGCNIGTPSPMQRYVNQLVRVSGNLTNCLSVIRIYRGYNDVCGLPLCWYEFNILELISIQTEKQNNINN